MEITWQVFFTRWRWCVTLMTILESQFVQSETERPLYPDIHIVLVLKCVSVFKTSIFALTIFLHNPCHVFYRVVGKSEALSTVKKVNQASKEKEDSNGLKLRESSHEYDWTLSIYHLGICGVGGRRWGFTSVEGLKQCSWSYVCLFISLSKYLFIGSYKCHKCHIVNFPK